MIIIGLSVIKIITKQQVTVFVVIFLFCFLGFLITDYEIQIRDKAYGCEEKQVEVTGRISKIVKNQYGFYIYLQNVYLEQMKLRQMIVETENAEGLKIGNKVKVSGRINHFSTARNRGNFDSRKYYMSLGIYLKISAKKMEITDSDYDGIRHCLVKLKNSMEKKLNQICNGHHKGILKVLEGKNAIYEGILLGDKSDMNTEIKELYSLSGISHVLAISGLHISIIGMFVYRLLRKRCSFGTGAFFSVTVVVGFGLLSGMAIASIRAIVMFGLKLLGEVLGRNYDYVTAISLAGFMLLLGNPFVIYNAGFQMSFVAIISIVIVWKKIMYIFQLKAGNKIKKSILFSLTISICMNPIVAYHYFTLPTYSFLLNMLVVPLMSVVVISGASGIGISYFGTGVGSIVLMPGCLVLELYEQLCNISLKLPFASVIVGQPHLAALYIYYLFLFVALLWLEHKRRDSLKKKRQQMDEIPQEGITVVQYCEKQKDKKGEKKFWIFLLVLTLLLEMILYGYYPIERCFSDRDMLTVTMLDVGQGDGMVIRTPDNRVITIDGGSTSVDLVGKYRMMPFLKSQCIREIEYAVMTHADSDHVNGLLELMKESDKNGVKIKNLVLPAISLKDEAYNQMIQTAGKHHIPVRYITKGDYMQFGEVKFQCIHPCAETISEDRNDYSTVLKLTYKKFSMIFTGDISSTQEQEIAEDLKQCTILKVAHHGSKYSSCDNFLQTLSPRYSLISVGEKNLYGHPHQDTLQRLEASGSIVLRTDESGEITVKSGGENMVLEKTR